MKRPVFLGALLVALLACAAALSKPAPLHAVLCCDFGGYTTSSPYWAIGSTCSEAIAAFRAAALPEAQAYCGGATRVCAVSTPDCFYDANNNWYEVAGYLTFSCREQCPIYP